MLRMLVVFKYLNSYVTELDRSLAASPIPLAFVITILQRALLLLKSLFDARGAHLYASEQAGDFSFELRHQALLETLGRLQKATLSHTLDRHINDRQQLFFVGI